ncbi:MAG: hypothetical protein N2Z76_06970 [Treponemataceae bacterium]|nr:hypothetical protein [Treponemataceae bacterium]
MNDLFPIAPFWFWNGEIKEEHLIEQLRVMHQKRIQACIICARQGLRIPYLSKNWFRLVRQIIKEAKRLGMQIWLYDEYPYPSLAAGGRVVLEHPEFEAKELKIYTFEVTRGTRTQFPLEWGRVLWARAYPLQNKGNPRQPDWEKGIDLVPYIGTLFTNEVFHNTGLTSLNQKRFLACEPTLYLDWDITELENKEKPIIEGSHPLFRGNDKALAPSYYIYIAEEIPLRGHKYYDRFPDPLNPEAVSYFIQLTHERYREELGDEFGKTIKGFFTDEIHPIGFEGAGIPWSPQILPLYWQDWHEELLPLLPALTETSFPDGAKVRYRFMKSLTDGFIKSYDQTIGDWCRKHKLYYIGEKPILRSSQLRYMDIPGIDTGHQKAGEPPEDLPTRYRANPRILTSAARLYEKTYCLCEAFHSIGWGMELQDMKWTYDRLALQGVNFFVPHAYYYTTAALAKHDAPPSSFIQMPWWPYQDLLSEYVVQLLNWTNIQDRCPRILLLDPVTSQWSLPFDSSKRKEEAASFAELQNIIFSHHFDFWIIDPELFQRTSVEKGMIKIGDQSFECVIVPPCHAIEDGVYHKALTFLETGGKLLWCGKAPVNTIGDISLEAWEELWKHSRVIQNISDIPDVLEEAGLRDFSIQYVQGSQKGREATEVQGMLYQHKKSSWLFVVNPLPEEKTVLICGPILKKNGSGGANSQVVHLAPFESRCISFSRQRKSYSHQTSVTAYKPDSSFSNTENIPSYEVIDLDIKVPHSIEILSENTLLLDRWILKLEGTEEIILVEPMPLIDQCSRGNLRLPLHIKDRFGNPKELLFPPQAVTYFCEFYCQDFTAPLTFLIEKDSLIGDWALYFNDQHIDITDYVLFSSGNPTNGSFLSFDGLETYCIKLGTPKEGLNKLEIRLTSQKEGQGLRAAPHLAGYFSVLLPRRDKEKSFGFGKEFSSSIPTLVPLIKQGVPLELQNYGYPHYAGYIRYGGTFMWAPPNKKELNIQIRIPDSSWRAASHLWINGFDLGRRAWHPFVWHFSSRNLQQGINHYILEVATTRLGYFEGMYYDFQGQRYLRCNDT